jgi:hypothetical protein
MLNKALRRARKGFRRARKTKPWLVCRRRVIRPSRRLIRRIGRRRSRRQAIRELEALPYWLQRRRLRRHGMNGSLHFAPTVPSKGFVIGKVAHYLGLDVVSRPRADTLVSMLWLDATKIPTTAVEPAMLNARCVDISKSRVDRAMQEVFGYSLGIDPRLHRGPAVRRTDTNGTHDGQVVECPVDPEPGFIYQRLVNNAVGDLVEDFRPVVVGGSVPLVYVKYRKIARRFQGTIRARLCEPDDAFSSEELRRLLALCANMGLDVGEIDVLRDRDSGRLYVVDVNSTPAGPHPKVSKRDTRRAIHRIAEAFTALLQSPQPVVGERPGAGSGVAA